MTGWGPRRRVDTIPDAPRCFARPVTVARTLKIRTELAGRIFKIIDAFGKSRHVANDVIILATREEAARWTTRASGPKLVNNTRADKLDSFRWRYSFAEAEGERDRRP